MQSSNSQSLLPNLSEDLPDTLTNGTLNLQIPATPTPISPPLLPQFPILPQAGFTGLFGAVAPTTTPLALAQMQLLVANNPLLQQLASLMQNTTLPAPSPVPVLTGSSSAPLTESSRRSLRRKRLTEVRKKSQQDAPIQQNPSSLNLEHVWLRHLQSQVDTAVGRIPEVSFSSNSYNFFRTGMRMDGCMQDLNKAWHGISIDERVSVEKQFKKMRAMLQKMEKEGKIKLI